MLQKKLKYVESFYSNSSWEKISSANQAKDFFKRLSRRLQELLHLVQRWEGRFWFLAWFLFISWTPFLEYTCLPHPFEKRWGNKFTILFWERVEGRWYPGEWLRHQQKREGFGRWGCRRDLRLFILSITSTDHAQLALYCILIYFGFWARPMAHHTYSIVSPHSFTLCEV